MSCFSQQIDVKFSNTPLSQILVSLRDKYNLQLSFNDQLLAKYSLSLDNHYSSPEQAIQALLVDFPLSYSKQGEVFLILPKENRRLAHNALLIGQISESRSQEPLPFSQVLVDNRVIVSDIKGNFSYPSTQDSIFHIRVSHLGYFILDTIVSTANFHRFNLVPTSIGLKEIVIQDKTIEKSTQIGSRAGLIKVNHQIAKYLPSGGDNSVFTLLRLMPGILASSEQSNGLIIWGSYEGHSQILFDGFTIWGLKSFNDDIEAVNPLLAKDIEVLKGGYDASYGGRVGGLVNIIGKTGNLVKPTFTLNLNNVTVNGMAEVPLWKRSSILLSFRQTYYNLYKGKDVLPANNQNEVIPVNTSKSAIDFTVHPDYIYQDANIRFTTRAKNSDLFYVSLLGGEDRFRYAINPVADINGLFKINAENNLQVGASSFYGHKWKNGMITNISGAWSTLQTELSNIQSIQRKKNVFDQIVNNQTSNLMAEYSGKIDHILRLSSTHILEAGAGFNFNETGLKADSSGFHKSDLYAQISRVNGYLQDHITLPNEIDIKIGLRADFPLDLIPTYLQPRISASFKVSDRIKLNAAWGIYNQFIAKSSVVDNQGNYRYIWSACDNMKIPVLEATHYVLGSSYHQEDYTISLETYYKKTSGITRFVNSNQSYSELIYNGKGRSYGVDLFVKKEFGQHSAWISYTLSRTEEKFAYFPKNEYLPSPQDQRHEVKVAGLFYAKPFHISAVYVYGSGFPLYYGSILTPNYTITPYNRMDVSVNYRFAVGKISCETGLSILNLFNSKNIHYTNFERVPVDQSTTINIFSQAIPFSPRLNLRLFY